MKYFQIGDKVSWVTYGGQVLKGVIDDINSIIVPSGSISVKFINHASVTFNPDGRYLLKHPARSLFHGHNIKVEITGEEEPERYGWVNVYMGSEGSGSKVRSSLTYNTENIARDSISNLSRSEYIATIHLKPKYK